MPKINNNPIMKGARGMLGGVVVYRQFRGMTIMSNRPRKAKVITPHQQAIKSRFLLAVEYAKKQIADPVLKAKYEPDPGSKFTSAYVAAIADYLRRAKQNDTSLEDNQDSVESAVCVSAETDKSGSKTDVIKYSENVAEGREQHARTGPDFVHRHTVTISKFFTAGMIAAYPLSTVILSGTSADKRSQIAAKDLLQISRVGVRRRKPFARCFSGILRSRPPTPRPMKLPWRDSHGWHSAKSQLPERLGTFGKSHASCVLLGSVSCTTVLLKCRDFIFYHRPHFLHQIFVKKGIYF